MCDCNLSGLCWLEMIVSWSGWGGLCLIVDVEDKFRGGALGPYVTLNSCRY